MASHLLIKFYHYSRLGFRMSETWQCRSPTISLYMHLQLCSERARCSATRVALGKVRASVRYRRSRRRLHQAATTCTFWRDAVDNTPMRDKYAAEFLTMFFAYVGKDTCLNFFGRGCYCKYLIFIALVFLVKIGCFWSHESFVIFLYG